jgi:GNAT superfamily N-acetyltransferase
MTYVAESAGEVVGVIGAGVGNYYEKNGSYGRLLALVVGERYRGRGVGASLVAEAELWLKGLGASTVIVNSGSQRGEAHRFYRRLGYSETGLRFVKALP